MRLYVVIWLVSSVFGFVWVRWNRVRARRLLEDLDAGRRCVACERSDVTVSDGIVHCNDCGHDARLDEMRRAQISASDIANVSARDSFRR